MATLSQLPDTVDLSFVAGDTFRIRVRIIDPASTEPQPVSGYVIAAWIAKDGDNIADFEVDNTSDPIAVILTLSSKETEMIFAARGSASEFTGKWDLEVTFPPVAGQSSGDVRTVAKGSVTVYDDITNSGTPSPPPEPLP